MDPAKSWIRPADPIGETIPFYHFRVSAKNNYYSDGRCEKRSSTRMFAKNNLQHCTSLLIRWQEIVELDIQWGSKTPREINFHASIDISFSPNSHLLFLSTLHKISRFWLLSKTSWQYPIFSHLKKKKKFMRRVFTTANSFQFKARSKYFSNPARRNLCEIPRDSEKENFARNLGDACTCIHTYIHTYIHAYPHTCDAYEIFFFFFAERVSSRTCFQQREGENASLEERKARVSFSMIFLAKAFLLEIFRSQSDMLPVPRI